MKKFNCKRILVVLAIVMAFMSLQSCAGLSNMSYEDSYRNGYNMGVMLRGGDSSEFLRK